jgi:hypothetical protein
LVSSGEDDAAQAEQAEEEALVEGSGAASEAGINSVCCSVGGSIVSKRATLAGGMLSSCDFGVVQHKAFEEETDEEEEESNDVNDGGNNEAEAEV